MTKNSARKQLLKLRALLSCEVASADKIERLKQSGFLKAGMKVGLYYPILNEINLLPLVYLYPDVAFFLPITRQEIAFVPYQLSTPLVRGPYHTIEPVGETIDIDLLDGILIPCLGISQDGKRLGYGKGYYDRALKLYQGKKIGVCYDELCHQNIEMEEFDLTLDWIL